MWPGDSLIFEGTEGLPAQIARRLDERGLTIAVSEQFTGGLLALQLNRAQAKLQASCVFTAALRHAG
ncbi:CinA-like protein [Cedecea lapagei]|uniref:CinA-like protein n=1 Tax=Cedecea lapagei TaxID=158823 RepID=A0A3S4ICT1_9ENTR|nr:CinA-like protein [Cedecea lapagei]